LSNEEIIIPEHFPEKAKHLRLYILIAAGLLLAGLVSPIITLTKFMFVENTFSVLSGVVELLMEGRIFLFLLIAGFSIVLPILKLWVLYQLVSKRSAAVKSVRRLLHWMHLYGKWSMLDVFVVAILVVAVKLGAIADVEMRFGLYAFAASVLITMLITSSIVSLTNLTGPTPPGRAR
jgi:paraquat-inducible protein A